MISKKVKIVATIGPSSNSSEKLKQLILAGVNVFRLNMSHGTHKEHLRVINIIKVLRKKMNEGLAILMDLQGPKIRVGDFKNGEVLLRKGHRFTLTTRSIIGNLEKVSTTYKKITLDVKPGHKLLMDDGLLELKVLKVKKSEIVCQVSVGGILKEHKGINLPGVKVSEPALTKKDLEDLKFGIKCNVDYFALSFVRKPQDILKIKSKITNLQSDIPVIAKIENPEALNQIEQIIRLADGIMVARGDLGVEISPEKVPRIQKNLIRLANRFNKPVITATQMLESMIQNPTPTRAEASDVANAVIDGTDAVMLSAETAVGKYPVKSVKMMCKIIHDAEKVRKTETVQQRRRNDITAFSRGRAIIHSACVSAFDVNAKGILAFTRKGSSAVFLSKEKPKAMIFGIAYIEKIYYRMALLWGVTPLLIPLSKSNTGMLISGHRALLKKKYLPYLSTICIVSGNVRTGREINLLKIEQLGETLKDI